VICPVGLRVAGQFTGAMKILVAYGTKKGSTGEVADVVAETLREQGFDTDLLPASQVKDLGSYAAVVLGGSIYTGRMHPDLMALLKRLHGEFERLPVAVFGMGPKTTEEGDIASARKQVDANLKRAKFEPAEVAIFGGVVDPAKLRFPFNRMPASDARDWDAIRDWSASLPEKLGLGQVGLARVSDGGVGQDVDERRLA
jgi:menaquinone-dependent protoporphyrinogen oxidase